MTEKINKTNKIIAAGKMVDRKEWKEFRDSRMLWIANRTLHLFGWSIVYETNSDGEIVNAFPARVKYRGFDEKKR